MKKACFSCLIIVCILWDQCAFSQLIYDFENQNLDVWTQSRANAFVCTANTPINGSFSLQHNYDSPASDHDQISIKPGIMCLDSTITTWQFKIRHGYAPSSSNNWAIFLVADNDANSMCPSSDVSGYVIGVNYTGSDDTIRLWKVVQGTVSEVINTHYNWQDSIGISSFASFQVVRDECGFWEIGLARPSSPSDYRTIGSGDDPDLQSGSYFGLYYLYSSAQDRKIWLDDINIDAFIYSDTIAPKIINLEAWSAHEVILTFSEPADEITTRNLSNYFLNEMHVSPDSVCLENSSELHLYFAKPLSAEDTLVLIVNNITDISGNLMVADSIPFVYNKPNHADIVINEIMFDPSPPIDLSEYEYVEIFNNSNKDINLKEWTIQIGSIIKNFPDITLSPDSFLIICHTGGVSEFSNYGDALGLFSSTTTLPNGGQSIIIKDRDGSTIDSVNYSVTSIEDNLKSGGGWSLELIDPKSSCAINNWSVAIDPSGGTPGRINSIYQPNSDIIPPRIDSIYPSETNNIIIELSEPVQGNQLNDISNYIVMPAENAIDSAVITNPGSIQLSLHNPFTNGIEYTVTIKQLVDACGNVADSVIASFIYYKAELFDIIISEIMAIPTESDGLPNCEWIEIYNTSSFPIDLSGYGLADATDTAYFESATIAPDAYAILCDNDHAADMIEFGDVISLSSFPQLNNSGELLQILDENKKLIHFVNYSSNWFTTDYKLEGGWSLEIIDPDNPCNGKGNWEESQNDAGGTPGTINSIDAENPDIDNPWIDLIYPLDSNQILVHFNEPVDLSNPEMLPGIFSFENNTLQIETTHSSMIISNSLILNVTPALIPSENYLVIINTGLTDCVGNLSGSCTKPLALPQIPDSMDLVINEILFQPYTFCNEFIELYNNSNKPIDLKDLVLEVVDMDYPEDASKQSFTELQRIIWPGEYIVFTEDTSNISQTYQSINSNSFVQITDLPSLDDNEGIIRISLNNGSIIDEFYYLDDMHFPLLSSTSGVSLERIRPDCHTNSESNWHSAAENIGFATPGVKNSQDMTLDQNQAEPISISPEIFSPDNDGYNDYLTIACITKNPGTIVNISIFNASGSLIKRLIKNESVGSEAIFTWDGMDEEKQAELPGIFIVYFESFDATGEVLKYKKPFVLAYQF